MMNFKKLGNIVGKQKEPQMPEGLWLKCDECGQMLYREDVVEHAYRCYKCGKNFRISPKIRLKMVMDKGSFTEWDRDPEAVNPLDFSGYPEKVKATQERLKTDEAVTTGIGTIHGEKVVIAICNSRFMMGSMGHIVGEKITRAAEKATEMKLQILIFACSGGSRMQEGMVSLMQMAKTSAALKKHSDAGLLYICVLTDPTTGGVTASFAMLADITLAEPGALIGFAGPRVIEQTIGQKLPKGFQRAEFLKEHGFVDDIVERDQLKDTLATLLRMHHKVEGSRMLIQSKLEEQPREHLKNDRISTWERVQIARSNDRPTALDYIQEIFTGFMEFHGDRYFGDDGAIVGGIAYLDGCPVTVIGQQKGKNTKENIHRNFGMPSPEGYRKALRLMEQAEKFKRPIINFVDTPGAYPGLEAEERGQGEAIARNLYEMSSLGVPVLSIVIGEGGSGGALALAVANEVWMMENATYSILSPEGFASILWKDSKRASEAAEVMKMTSHDLKKLHIIEHIIAEPEPISANTLRAVTAGMKDDIRRFLGKYIDMEPEQLAAQRYDRFRVI